MDSPTRASRSRRRGADLEETETPRSDDSAGSYSGIDDDTEESLIAKKVERLAHSLQDTGKNLRNVSGMLEEFRERDQDRGAAMDQLRAELQNSTDLLREERRRSAQERNRMGYSHGRRRSLSPANGRRVTLAGSSFSGSRQAPVHQRANRSVSPSIGRQGSYRQYRSNTGGVGMPPLHIPRDISSGANYFADTVPHSDRSNGDAETKELLHELIENQRSLLQAQSVQPLGTSATLNTHATENERIAQLEKMLNKLQDEVKESREAPKSRMRQYDNPEISEELRKDLMSQHMPQIRTPRSPSSVHQQQQTKSAGNMGGDDSYNYNDQNERNLKRKLIRSESAIVELEKQLEEAYRRLENAEVARSEAQKQGVELKEQLNRSEQERDLLRSRVNDYTNDLQREVARREDSFCSEKRILEEEIRKLKSQLNDPRRNTETETLKAEFEKVDRLKTNLTTKNEDLQRKNQEKDMELTQFSYKMREITNKLEDSDRVKKKAISRVDDLTRELNVLKIEREKMIEQLKSTEIQLNQKVKDNEDLTTKANLKINGLKGRVQKLMSELDRANNANRAQVDRINGLEKEAEAGRIAATADNAQLSAIHREIHDLMVLRSEQEDLMRRKNEEIHELRGDLESLQRAHTGAKDDMDKMEEEITLNRKRLMEGDKIRDEQDEELHRLRADLDNIRDELNRVTVKDEELLSQIDQMQRRISEEVKDKDEAKTALMQTEKKERLAREEISTLLIKINEQEETHHRIVNELKQDIQELVDVEQKNVQEMVNSMKAERKQLENQIADLRCEVSDEKEKSRGLREDVEKMQSELEEASEKARMQSETEATLGNKVEALQFEITIKDNLAQELESRIKKLERTLKSAKEKMKKEEQDMLNLMTTVSRSVNGLVDIAAGEASLGRHKSSPISTSTDPSAWLAEIKAKLGWLTAEVSSWYSREKDVQTQLRRTQQDMMTLLNSSQQDKSFFLDQLEKQNSAIKHIASEREDCNLNNADQEARLLSLHHNVEDLSNRLQMSSQLLEARLNMIHLHHSIPPTNTPVTSSSAVATASTSTTSSSCSSARVQSMSNLQNVVSSSSSKLDHSASLSTSNSSVAICSHSVAISSSPLLSSVPNTNDSSLMTSSHEHQHLAHLKEDVMNNNISEISSKTIKNQAVTIGATYVVSSSSLLPSVASKLDGIVEILPLKSSRKSASSAKVKFHPNFILPAIESSDAIRKSSSNKTKEAERDRSEFNVKFSAVEEPRVDNVYSYQATKSSSLSNKGIGSYITSSGATGTLPSVTTYGGLTSAPGMFSTRTEGTDSTVTPEQSVVHYAPPLSMDFSGVPFNALGPSMYPHMTPQSCSTPAPMPHGYSVPVRQAHTPPTRHQGYVLENGATVGMNGVVTSTSSLPNYLNLNHRTPMTMSDEEFANNFIPHTPPGVASLAAMQPEREMFVGKV